MNREKFREEKTFQIFNDHDSVAVIYLQSKSSFCFWKFPHVSEHAATINIPYNVQSKKKLNEFILKTFRSSSLYVTDNDLICDCRLAWMFDLKNRTKNFQLRYSLEDVECMMKTKERTTSVRVKVNADDVMKKQILNDEIEYYEDESYDDKKMTQLFQLKQRDLPCPQQYREQLEHPSTREFIGFDLSWIRSSAPEPRNTISLLFTALTSHFACTLAAFFR